MSQEASAKQYSMGKPKVAPEDADRAVLYGFLGKMMQSAPSEADLQTVRGLAGDQSLLGRALDRLSETAVDETVQSLDEAYQELFIGIGRGEFMPFGSYYLTGFLHERPLAELRASMAELGIERADGVSEPEDHIAALMQMMEGLILGHFGEPAAIGEQRAFFSKHIGSWAGHFFKDLSSTRTNAFYAALGVLGDQFLSIEAEAFDMSE